ncbi:MAG: TRAP transporter substrate-binding protein DctP [Chloroflexota bacterium]
MAKQMRNMAVILVVLVSLLTTIVLGGCGAPAPTATGKVIEWKIQSHYPASDYCTSVQAAGYVKAINDKCQGRLKLTLFNPDQVVAIKQELQAVQSGQIDGIMSCGVYFTGVIPVGQLDYGLPFSFNDGSSWLKFMYQGGFVDFLREEYKKINVYYAAPAPMATTALMTTFPVATLADLKGKKVREAGLATKVYQNWGMAPTPLPNPEMYMGLKLGTIDAIVYTLMELKSMSFWEVVKYTVFPSKGAGNIALFINLDAWNSLPDDLKKTVNQALVDAAPVVAAAYAKDDKPILDEAVAKHGVKVVQLPDADAKALRAYAATLWDEEAKKSPASAKGVQMIKDWLKKEGLLS